MKNVTQINKQANKKPLVTMPERWWQIMAVIYQLTEIERTQASISEISKSIGMTQNAVRSSGEWMISRHLIDWDSDHDSGRLRFYFLTDEGYRLLADFSNRVSNSEQARQFYSNHYKKAAA